MEIFNAKLKREDLPGKNLSIRIDRAIRSSGLLAFLSPEDFQTLMALLTFVDDTRRCDLSGRTLGQTLNLSAGQAHERLKKLCRIRWRERPLVVKENGRKRGRFLPTSYQVMDVEGLKIEKNREHGSRNGKLGDSLGAQSQVMPEPCGR